MLKINDKLYLAHSCQLIKSVRKWELKIEGKYRIDLINPFKNNSFENMEELIKLTSKRKLLNYMKNLEKSVCKKIVKYDLQLLRQCDGILAIFTNPSVGVAQEIFAAHFLYQLPVYVICGNYRFHPWIVTICEDSGGQVFKSRAEFVRYLKSKNFERE